jgi:hypothetical protein
VSSAGTNARAHEPTDDLTAEVEGNVLGFGLLDRPRTDGHGRVDVTTRDRPDGVGRAQQGESERDGDTEHADRGGLEESTGRENRGPGSADDEDHGADAFGESDAYGLFHGRKLLGGGSARRAGV